MLLKYPYPREVSEPVQYDYIRVHAQMGQVAVESDRLRLAVRAVLYNSFQSHTSPIVFIAV